MRWGPASELKTLQTVQGTALVSCFDATLEAVLHSKRCVMY